LLFFFLGKWAKINKIEVRFSTLQVQENKFIALVITGFLALKGLLFAISIWFLTRGKNLEFQALSSELLTEKALRAGEERLH